MKITLYVDVVSPFAYVAYHVLRVSTASHVTDGYGPKLQTIGVGWYGVVIHD